MTTTALEVIPSATRAVPLYAAATAASLACVFVACLLEQQDEPFDEADLTDGVEGAIRGMPSGEPYGIQIFDVTVSLATHTSSEGSDYDVKWMARRGSEYVIADIHYPSYCDDETDGWIQNVTETLTRTQAIRHLRAAVAAEKADLNDHIKRIKQMAIELNDALKAEEANANEAIA